MISKSEIKVIRSLKLKKFRQKYNLFVAEGERIIGTMLRHNSLSLHKLYVTSSWSGQLANSIPSEKIHFTEPSYLRQVSTLTTAPAVLGVFEIPAQETGQIANMGNVMYVDDIQDPGNLGTIIRIADWFGVAAVIRSTGSADFYAPKVVQSAMGSIGHVRCLTLSRVSFKSAFSNHYKVGAMLEATKNNTDKKEGPICLVIGNEGNGISSEIAKELNHAISIPGYSGRMAESLNAGVATGILCHKLFGEKL